MTFAAEADDPGAPDDGEALARSRPPDFLRRHERPARLIVFLAWLATAGFLASRHVVWRDEVRAYTLATTGATVGDMLRAVHGEGHPGLWYLLLRAAHAVAPYPQVLPAMGFVVGVAAALLFALRAPFRWPFIAIALFGRFALYEYTVMARNYGISMLILFAFAALYPRCRDRQGWALGGLLLLLCNTNVHSVGFAAALLLFWAIDLAGERPIGWTQPWRGFLAGAALAAAGAVLCVLEIYPPFNDAAPAAAPTGSILAVAFSMGEQFASLAPKELGHRIPAILIPLLLAGCLLRWVRRPGVILAGGVGLLSLLLLFTFVYGAAYRHQALALAFLLTLAWLAAEGCGDLWPAYPNRTSTDSRPLERAGAGALLILLAFQIVLSVSLITRAVRHMPESRSAELAQLLKTPALREAIVIGDPDYNLEPLPYYVSNPTYFVRERRYGQVVFFSKAAKRTITPIDVLETARRLHAQTGRTVVMVMSETIFREGKPGAYPRGFYGGVVVTAQDLARFHAATRRIASFGRLTAGDETYDVFVLET